jgi:hypothetical protein
MDEDRPNIFSLDEARRKKGQPTKAAPTPFIPSPPKSLKQVEADFNFKIQQLYSKLEYFYAQQLEYNRTLTRLLEVLKNKGILP